MMRITPTKFPGVVVIDPVVHRDPRGFFVERYHARTYAEHVLPREFVQDNHSRSVKGTLRGLHLQVSQLQGKLVYVLEGSIFDVAVDVRVDSPSFGQWVGIELTSDNFRQLYIPPGFAHGFCVTSDRADVLYKCTDFYLPGDEITICWNDPEIAIQWPIMSPLLSQKDACGFTLKHVMSRLPTYKANGQDLSRNREIEAAGKGMAGDSA
jgi:dTDP-4-dehydrorhamnose 3,5-epimerase